MYGAILGDIIGSPYEFDRGSKTKDFPLFSGRSEFTDDTVMTIAVADAFLPVQPDMEDDTIRQRVVTKMQKYGRLYPHAGYGGRFRHWLRDRYPQPYNSWGNGSAMRVSSVGWLYNDLETVRRMARLSAEVTHNHTYEVEAVFFEMTFKDDNANWNAYRQHEGVMVVKNSGNTGYVSTYDNYNQFTLTVRDPSGSIDGFGIAGQFKFENGKIVNVQITKWNGKYYIKSANGGSIYGGNQNYLTIGTDNPLHSKIQGDGIKLTAMRAGTELILLVDNVRLTGLWRDGSSLDLTKDASGNATGITADMPAKVEICSWCKANIELPFELKAEQPTYSTVTIPTVTNGAVTVDKRVYLSGETVTATATPDSGYFFGGLYVDGALASRETTCEFTATKDSHSISAVFGTGLFTDNPNYDLTKQLVGLISQKNTVTGNASWLVSKRTDYKDVTVTAIIKPARTGDTKPDASRISIQFGYKDATKGHDFWTSFSVLQSGSTYKVTNRNGDNVPFTAYTLTAEEVAQIQNGGIEFKVVKTGTMVNLYLGGKLIVENINKDNSADNFGSVVIKNGDLCRTGTHNVRVEAGNLTLIDTKIQGHTSGVANDIHAIYVSNKTENINLDGVTVLDAAGDALRIASGNVVAENFTSNQTGRNGVWANGGSLTAKNLTVSGSKNVGVYITGGTAVVNGANISGSANNVSVTGVELTINGYADGSKSQIGTSSKDNVVANDGGVVRLNNATVLESKANNIVTTKGKVFLTDVAVTGGNYSVLVQDAGYAELNNVTIKDSVKDGIRVNRADGVVVTNNVQINNPIRYGISAEKGTVELKGELSVSSNAKKSRAIYACIGGKVTTADNAEVTISGTEYGIFADSNAVIDMDNVAISGCTKSSFEMTGGTAVLNGVNISGSSSNNILVSDGELTVNGYSDGSKSQIGTAKEDNIKAIDKGVVRLNDVNVLKTSKNNVVAIDGGTIHVTDSAVTGGNHSVLAQSGEVYLNNTRINASGNSGIRVNRADSYVEATGLTINGANVGLSIELGKAKIDNLTVRNCGEKAIYTTSGSTELKINNAVLSHSGSEHAIHLNGGNMILNSGSRLFRQIQNREGVTKQ